MARKPAPGRLGPFDVVGPAPDDEGELLGHRPEAAPDEVVVLRPLRAGESLARTARSLPQLRHSGLCTVLHVEAAGPTPFCAREHVSGRPLEVVLARLRSRGETLDGALAHHIAREVLGTLDFLHRQTDPLTRAPLHLAHGAVDAACVLLGYDGEVRLKDFGLRLSDDAADQQAAARLARRLFAEAAGADVPPPVEHALATPRAFESCAAFAEALRGLHGQGERPGKKALRDLMGQLFEAEAEGDRDRLRQLLRRHQEHRQAAKDLPELKGPAEDASPRAVTGHRRGRDDDEDAPAATASSAARWTRWAVGFGIVVIVGAWAAWLVSLFAESGGFGAVTPMGALDDGPSFATGELGRSPPPHSNQTRVRNEGKSPSGGGGKGKVLSPADRTIVDGCAHPCAAAVLKAMVPGGSVERDDEGYEVLTRANIDSCIALCRE